MKSVDAQLMSFTEPIITKHLEWMRVRNLRSTSVYNRARTLARFTAWAGGPILYLTEEDLKRWQLERSQQIAPPAMRGEMSNVRQFYRWVVREGLRMDDPTIRLDLPRVPRRLPRPIADADLARAIEAADATHAVILGLACFAGLRACEIARLDWSHIVTTSDSPHLRVEDGKGGHGRIVPLADALTDLLNKLPHRRGHVIRRIDGRAHPYTPNVISHLANTYLHRAGIPETLHQARHRFASATYQACRDIRAVQDLMGHASPTTTSIYAQVAPGVASRAVQDAGKLAA